MARGKHKTRKVGFSQPLVTHTVAESTNADTMAHPSKRRKLDLSEEFQVTVGEGNGEQTFTVPKALLTKSSEFFKPACSREWKEGQAKKITLKEHSADAFSAYVQWLYTGELVVCDEDPPTRGSESYVEKYSEYAAKHYTPLFDLYHLGEFLMDMRLRNDVIDEVMRAFLHLNYRLPHRQLHKLFTSGREGSTLQCWVVDLYATTNTDSKWYLTAHKSTCLPGEFFSRLLCKLNQIRLSPSFDVRPEHMPKCTYHEHDANVPKCEPSIKSSPK